MAKPRPLASAEDQALLSVALRSPESPTARQAASDLLERYQDRVYLWCSRYEHDHERALDLAQEVLLTAYRKLASFQGRSGFGSWLFSIARNHCISERRRPSLLVSEGVDPDELPGAQGNPGRTLEDKLGEEEILALIRTHLEPREQEALWLRCFERMPVDTITTVLGITESSGARAVLQSARRKLRAALDRREITDSGGVT